MTAAVEEQARAVRELRAAVEELAKPAPPPAAAPAPAPEAKPAAPRAELSAEQLYAAALASFQAEEHGQAVLEFTELTRRFPEHPLASNAQYWVGEAYYRQRDFAQAALEFQKLIDAYPKTPQLPEALLKLGLCYRSLKDPARAREAWRRRRTAARPAERGAAARRCSVPPAATRARALPPFPVY